MLAVAALAVAAVVAVNAGEHRLVALLIRSGLLLLVAEIYWSQRAQWPVARRRIHAVLVAVLALGWVLAVAEYLRGG